MDITPLVSRNKLLIDRYGDGGFVMGDITHKGDIFITLDQVMAWPSHEAGALSAEAFTPLIHSTGAPEMLLIGTGKEFLPITATLRAALKEKNIACDAMDTGAACRTYNVLVAEGRRVMAALLAV